MRHSVYISLCISDDNLQVLSFASKIGTILSETMNIEWECILPGRPL